MINKAKYPRYYRKSRRSFKLTDKEIKQIKILFKKGLTKDDLAKRFNITRNAIYYWISEDRRVVVKKQAIERHNAKTLIQKRIEHLKHQREKRLRQKDRMKEWSKKYEGFNSFLYTDLRKNYPLIMKQVKKDWRIFKKYEKKDQVNKSK